MNKRLRELRNKLGLSQKEFGERIGITQSHVASLESGRRDLSDRNIQFISEIWGVNGDWIRTGKGEMFLNLVDDIKDIDDETRDILNKFQKLSNSDKEKMKKILDAFLIE